jgi:CBS domain containing-hemolysin-like protein
MLLKTIGVKPMSEHEVHSEEELKLIIAESVEGGQFEESERELIQNVFDFDDRHVKQVMIPRIKITGIQSETPVEEALRFALKEGYTRYPVFEKDIDTVLGIVHTKDLMREFIDRNNKSLIELAKEPHYVPENKRIDHLLREFQKSKTQMAIVVSEYGGTVGLVTLEDIIEELVGEIQDEFDREAQIVVKTSSGFRVLAKSSLHDINKYIEKPFQESEHYETLTGLLIYSHPTELKEGDVINVEGYNIKIVKMSRHLPEIVELVYDPLVVGN